MHTKCTIRWSSEGGLKVEASLRARIAAQVVEMFGMVQVIAGVFIGGWLMLTVDAPCEDYRLDSTCARYSWDWETTQWQTGAILVPSAIVTGSFFIMVGAYVNSRIASSQPGRIP